MPKYTDQILKELSAKKDIKQVYIPGIWTDAKHTKRVKTDYAKFLSEQIGKIYGKDESSVPKDNHRTSKAIVYNIFVRFFSAYDHDGNGKIGDSKNDITLNEAGIRETGTLLKTMALLPYLKSLGINTLHLLPITEIGAKGRKGDLGSPYAVKNPYKLDPNIRDPFVSLSAEEQYKALIESAHHYGMRVVQEFIFRTASKDSDWALEKPAWFYWIKKKQAFGPPKFSAAELEQILKVPEGKGKYIPPHKEYRNRFAVPIPEANFNDLIIPGAFADWPPNDLQPPWSDVTYLRLYRYDFEKENNFNYIAYNTIRYYDPELAKKEHVNEPLWEKICQIIPFYQRNFGIDGAMIDMGHALPNTLKTRIIQKAKGIDPSFTFWDENFNNKEETKKDGYDAVIGDAWYKITKRNGFSKLISESSSEKPLPFFGTAETHNSPRFTHRNVNRKKAAYLLFSILPYAIPFLHNGYELDENLPVNTGLNFTKDQTDFFADKRLPLFYKNALNWNTTKHIIPFIRKIAEVRKRYPWIFSKKNIDLLSTDNKRVSGFRVSDGKKRAFILFNTNFFRKEQFTAAPKIMGDYKNLLNETEFNVGEVNEIGKGKIIFGLKL